MEMLKIRAKTWIGIRFIEQYRHYKGMYSSGTLDENVMKQLEISGTLQGVCSGDDPSIFPLHENRMEMVKEDEGEAMD